MSEFEDRIKASPAARRLALELGIDITKVTGTGADGRIQLSDIENYRPQEIFDIAEEISSDDFSDIAFTIDNLDIDDDYFEVKTATFDAVEEVANEVAEDIKEAAEEVAAVIEEKVAGPVENIVEAVAETVAEAVEEAQPEEEVIRETAPRTSRFAGRSIFEILDGDDDDVIATEIPVIPAEEAEEEEEVEVLAYEPEGITEEEIERIIDEEILGEDFIEGDAVDQEAVLDETDFTAPVDVTASLDDILNRQPAVAAEDVQTEEEIEEAAEEVIEETVEELGETENELEDVAEEVLEEIAEEVEEAEEAEEAAEEVVEETVEELGEAECELEDVVEEEIAEAVKEDIEEVLEEAEEVEGALEEVVEEAVDEFEEAECELEDVVEEEIADAVEEDIEEVLEEAEEAEEALEEAIEEAVEEFEEAEELGEAEEEPEEEPCCCCGHEIEEAEEAVEEVLEEEAEELGEAEEEPEEEPCCCCGHEIEEAEEAEEEPCCCEKEEEEEECTCCGHHEDEEDECCCEDDEFEGDYLEDEEVQPLHIAFKVPYRNINTELAKAGLSVKTALIDTVMKSIAYAIYDMDDSYDGRINLCTINREGLDVKTAGFTLEDPIGKIEKEDPEEFDDDIFVNVWDLTAFGFDTYSRPDSGMVNIFVNCDDDNVKIDMLIDEFAVDLYTATIIAEDFRLNLNRPSSLFDREPDEE